MRTSVCFIYLCYTAETPYCICQFILKNKFKKEIKTAFFAIDLDIIKFSPVRSPFSWSVTNSE